METPITIPAPASETHVKLDAHTIIDFPESKNKKIAVDAHATPLLEETPHTKERKLQLPKRKRRIIR